MSDSLVDLRRRVRRWIAVEELLFETLGRWAVEIDEPAMKRTLATWCHRHAWHAELWRERLPTVAAVDDHDDVDAWVEPLREALAARSAGDGHAVALAALTESVLPALEAAVDEHRDAAHPLLDGPTWRVLDLVAADLSAERRALPHRSV